MTITINQISSGIGLRINNDIFLVTEFQHVKPGKGAAFVRVKIKNVRTDAVLEKTFRSSEKLEDVVLEEKELEFLYSSGGDFHFMDHSTYEQVALSADVVGDAAGFLLENLAVTGLASEGRILKVVLPTFIITEITQTEPGVKGDSSRAGTKPAQIATGTTVQVPLFVNGGDRIRIDTRTGQYVERVQS